MRAHTGTDVRAAERPLLDEGRGEALMRTAAWGLAEHVAAELRARGPVAGATVAALVGPGNNGGDALWALAFLRRRGVEAVAVPVRRDEAGEPVWHAAGWAALQAAGGRRSTAVPARAAVVVDAMLGTGARGGFTLPEPARHLPSGAAVVACDLPSGVDADTGAVPGEALAADLTVTFGASKTGLLLGAGPGRAGRVVCVDIGLGPHLPADPAAGLHVVDDDAVARLHPAPARDAHKYTRGVVGVVAGSERYPGAAVLAVGGILAGGAGMAHHGGPARAGDLVLAAHPAALTSADGPAPERADAWVLGPGLGDGDGARERVRATVAAVLASGADGDRGPAALVVDASALDLVAGEDLAALTAASARTVITPHAGEWARLRGRLPVPAADAVDVDEDGAGELARLRAWTAARGVTVLLKGPASLAVAPDGQAWLMRDGGPQLGVAGTGDVLAGALGAVLAAETARARRGGDERHGAARGGRPSPAALAAAAAWLHARAGVRQAADGRATADTLPAALGDVVARRWWENDAHGRRP